MNTETGEIMRMDEEAFKALPKVEQTKFIPVKRDLSKIEQANMQIKKYSLCGCGSGLKFKFCCYKVPGTY